jgi:hypothetical protein
MFTISLSTKGSAQHTDPFRDFIFQHFKTPEGLKDECKWIYTLVKIKLNPQKKIISYECLKSGETNYAPTYLLEKSFDFLIGYQLNEYTRHARSLIFYFAIANSDECAIKANNLLPGPSDVVQILLNSVEIEKKKNPHIDFYEKPIIIFPFHRNY